MEQMPQRESESRCIRGHKLTESKLFPRRLPCHFDPVGYGDVVCPGWYGDPFEVELPVVQRGEGVRPEWTVDVRLTIVGQCP